MDNRRYFINGFREGKRYFMSLVSGNITQEQCDKLMRGEVITIGDNEFWIDGIEESDAD